MSEEQFIKIIRESVKRIRESKKVSQGEMGMVIGLGVHSKSAQAAYSRLEKEGDFKISQLYKIARHLDLEPAYFIKKESLSEDIDRLIASLSNFNNSH